MRVNARQWQPLSGSSYARRREGGFRAALFLWEARCRSALSRKRSFAAALAGFERSVGNRLDLQYLARLNARPKRPG